MKSILLSSLWILTFTLLFVSCSEEENSRDIIELEINPLQMEIKVNHSDAIFWTITKNGEQITTEKPTFVSEDESIATVDMEGLVTAISPGLTKIHVTYQKTSKDCAITVPSQTVSEGSSSFSRIEYPENLINIGNYNIDEVMGMASMYTSEELLYNASQVIGVGIFTSDSVEDFNLYICEDNNGKPGNILITQAIPQCNADWNYCKLSEPFIPEEGKSYWFTMKGRSKYGFVGIEIGLSENDNRELLYYKGQWQPMSEEFIGLNSRASFMIYREGGDYEDELEQTATRLYASSDAYVLSNQTIVVSGAIMNIGVLDASDLQITATIGTQTFTENFEGITLKNGESANFSFGYTAGSSDEKVNIQVEPSDPIYSNRCNYSPYRSQFEVYSSSYPRKAIYLEQFTNQSNYYLPDEDEYISSVLSKSNHPDNYVWISHHAGNGSDDFTIPGSEKWATWSEISYTPAYMMNRYMYPNKDYIWFDYEYINKEFINSELGRPARASLNVSRTFDSSSNTLSVTVSGETKQSVVGLTVCLIQNNMVANQEGGSSSYSHQHVIRDYLSLWSGDHITVSNETYTKTYTYVIPDTIGKFSTDVDNMEIAVCVGAPSSTIENSEIYNAMRLSVSDD